MADTINQRYLTLKTEVIRQSSRPGDIDRVKFLFKNDIRSRRRMDNIRNTAELISVLEKRNVLNASDLHCIESICEALQLGNVILQHRQPPVLTQQPAGLANGILQEHNRVLTEEPPSVPERIHKLLTKQIGRQWKEFARSLKILEGDIDKLEEQYRYNPSERIREILRYHYDSRGDRNHFILMNALSDCRRKDLRKNVEEILSRRDLPM